MSDNEKNMMEQMEAHARGHGCPGSRFMQPDRGQEAEDNEVDRTASFRPVSRLNQWPLPDKLLPTQALFYDGRGSF